VSRQTTQPQRESGYRPNVEDNFAKHRAWTLRWEREFRSRWAELVSPSGGQVLFFEPGSDQARDAYRNGWRPR
jgi:hypothetical protein